MAIDELAGDARVRHARVSPEGMAAMAHTELQEEKLGRLVRGYPPEERRAFWIGVLLRDGAISVEQALANRTAAPLRPRRAGPPPLVEMVERECRQCHRTFEEPRRRGRPRTRCDHCRGGG